MAHVYWPLQQHGTKRSMLRKYLVMYVFCGTLSPQEVFVCVH